jgi:hypothetical protein
LYLEKPIRLKICNGREYFTLPILNLRGIFPGVMRLSCDAKITCQIRDKQQYEWACFGEEIWFYTETFFFFILS